MLARLLSRILPSWKNAALALLSAGLLALAFPDLDIWFAAWFALVPLMWAVEREKGSFVRSFVTGWLFGTIFFFSTCWWLTFAPIEYAGFPWPLAYSLIFIACLGAGVFPGAFAAILSILLRRFGSRAFLAAPFVWVFSEFLRYWMTGNNWNAVGYSQAFGGPDSFRNFASLGGVLAVSFAAAVLNSTVIWLLDSKSLGRLAAALGTWGILFICGGLIPFATKAGSERAPSSNVVAVQPFVPMSGIDQRKLEQLRERQFDLAEAEIAKFPPAARQIPTLVILPESPMNFMYYDDGEFRKFVGGFTTRNDVSLLFNSAEPDLGTTKYFNSAMLIGTDGKPAAQYDKIYLLPFGEAVPVPLESIVPAFVGNFAYGREYDLIPVGDAKAGIMICFESHFGALSREYVKNGADVLIEMTNDGYLGPTPVLRQHLANAVFRAVETNRPVLRVTNVGVTTYIDERGNADDPLPVYTEGTRVWSISKSDGSQTFYVKYGDWFAWLCSVVTVILLIFSAGTRKGRKHHRLGVCS